MAARFQQCVLLILDTTNGQIPMSRETRANLYTELARNLEGMADQIRTQLPNVAARYNQYSGAASWSNQQWMKAMCMSDFFMVSLLIENFWRLKSA